MVGLCLQSQGKYSEAEAKFRNILNNAPKDGRALPALGHLLAQQGRGAEAKEIANSIENLARTGKAMEVPLAIVYAGMDRKDEALHWLQKAYTNRDPSLVFLNVSPRLAALRSDARFQELLRKMKLI